MSQESTRPHPSLGRPLAELPRADLTDVVVLFQIPATQGSLAAPPSAGGGPGEVNLPRHIVTEPQEYMRPDMLIVDDLMRVLAYSPGIDCSRLQVSCDGGVLVASGSLRSRSERLLLEEFAANTLGVREYRDEVEISREPLPEGEDELILVGHERDGAAKSAVDAPKRSGARKRTKT